VAVNDALDKPVRDRGAAALAIAQEALRHIARIAPRADIRESADHALNKIGILMANTAAETSAIPVSRPTARDRA
jgi:hypothetical protein